MERPRIVLTHADQVLVHLLPGTQAGEHDIDVLARHGDHPLGDVEDPYGLAHIEDQHFSPATDGTGLDHELAGFGNGHEEARDLGIRHGDGPPAADLLGEQR